MEAEEAKIKSIDELVLEAQLCCVCGPSVVLRCLPCLCQMEQLASLLASPEPKAEDA